MPLPSPVGSWAGYGLWAKPTLGVEGIVRPHGFDAPEIAVGSVNGSPTGIRQRRNLCVRHQITARRSCLLQEMQRTLQVIGTRQQNLHRSRPEPVPSAYSNRLSSGTIMSVPFSMP